VLVTRSGGITWDTMYQLFGPVLGYRHFQRVQRPADLVLISYRLAAVALLALRALPDLIPGAAVAPALALAWRGSSSRGSSGPVRREAIALSPCTRVLLIGCAGPPGGRRDVTPGIRGPAEPRLALHSPSSTACG